jgi:ribonuclease VapC
VIVDSSAIIAIVTEEPGSEVYLRALLASPSRRVSAATLLEAAIVVDRHPNPLAAPKFDRLIERLRLAVEPVNAAQVAIARTAYKRYGRGSGHPAKLNFGDCFAYALAKDLDEPLLFVGQDFVHTDVRQMPATMTRPQFPEPRSSKMDYVEIERVDKAMLQTIPAEEKFLTKCSPEMREWYSALKRFMLGLGKDVMYIPRRQYISYWRSGPNRTDSVFAYVNIRPSQSRIIVDIGPPPGGVSFDGDFLVPWEGQQKKDKVVRMIVDSLEDVERAKPFIRESYTRT